MSVKKVMFLEWLKSGVTSKVITMKKAKDLYERDYAPVKNFDKFLYQV